MMILDFFIVLRKCEIIQKKPITVAFEFILAFLYLDQSSDLMYDESFAKFNFPQLIFNLLTNL